MLLPSLFLSIFIARCIIMCFLDLIIVLVTILPICIHTYCYSALYSYNQMSAVNSFSSTFRNKQSDLQDIERIPVT